MNFLLSYCHFFACVIYVILGVVIIAKDVRSRLNQVCAGIFACFFIWSFSYAWIQHPSVSESTAVFFDKFSSPGWILFGFFHLWFVWLYTRRKPFRFFKTVAAVLILVPCVLIYQQVVNSALISEHVRCDFGWLSPWSKSFWTDLYFGYYSGTLLVSWFLLFDFRKKTDNVSIKKQTTILIVSASVTIIIGSLLDVVLPLMKTTRIYSISDITTLIWAVGLTYVVVKYHLLDITPVIAAQRIVSVMQDLLFLLDTRGRIISINQSALATLMCSDDQLIGRPFIDVIATSEKERENTAQAIIESSVYTTETALSLEPGPSILVSLSTSVILGTGIVCVAHDISLQKQRAELLNEAKKRLEIEISSATEELQKTNEKLVREIAERKQATLALMETEERFRVIYEHAPDGIVLVAPDGGIVEGNDEAGRILGYAGRELKGKNASLLGILPPSDDPGLPDGRRLDAGALAAESREATLVRIDGAAVPVEINSHPIKISDRNLILGVIRDLTHRKKAETEAENLKRELHQAQKMEAIGRLAGGIAHDFNNLLGGITGYSGLLFKKLVHTSPGEAKIVQKIIDAARQASHRTAQLLAFARKGKYQVAPIVMHDLIDEVIGLLEHITDRKITLTKNLRAPASTVMGDRSQLHSAILNLGINARDAMPEGGDINFSTEIALIGDELAQKSPYAISPGTFLKMAVADSGGGMNEEVRSHVFEPFFSTKEPGKGTGLGLASVYGTVKHHNGFIELWSEPGKGSVFTVYLPLSTIAPVSDNANEPSIAPVVHRHANILVVDDVPMIREIATDVLHDLGYTVNACSDGSEALTWFQEHFSVCDLVLLDLTMPKLSGRECFRAMKKIQPALKVIITSGHAMDNEIGELLDEGAMAFLQKPFEIERLSDLVNKTLSTAGTA